MQGTDVPLLAQIVGVVDTYDSATSSRPYQPRMSADEALALLREEVACGWRQAAIVEAFVEIMSGPLHAPVE